MTYAWLSGGSTDNIVGQDERKFISLDGTLFFSHLMPEDQNSYACSLSVYSTQAGSYGPFFRLISSTDFYNETFTPRLDSSQPQIFPEEPKIGDSIYLECFAYGNPIPQYKWSRLDGKPLPSRAHISNYGRVLKIDKATYSDSGRYKCLATNPYGSVAGEITVRLRAPPTILQGLHDHLISTESNARFECLLSSADSDSTVEWFKDTKPIAPLLMPAEQRKRISIRNNILTISGTTESDSGVYQCIVANDVGSSTSSALLYVKDSKPTFPPNAMPRRVFATVESTVRIPCIFEASPRVHGRWSDEGGSHLPTMGRLRDEHGIMTIEKVLMEDSGLFFCTAHNRIGKAHAQVQLIIMEKPSIRTKANNARYSSDDAVNISCEVEMECVDNSECPESLVEYKINDRPMSAYPAIRTKVHEHAMRKANHRGKHVKQLMDIRIPNDGGGKTIGRFACSSLYGGFSEVVPRPHIPSPIALTIEETHKGTTLRLRWRLPPQHRDTRDHSSKIDEYVVELRTKRNRKWIAADHKLVSHMEKDSVTVKNLAPNTEYQFRVRSVESSIIGEPSIPSEWIRTPPGPPIEKVDALKWRPLDSQTLLVEWQPIELQQHSGDNLRYRVSWQESSPNRTLVDDVERNNLDSDQPQAILKLNSTDGCRMVVLKVTPVNDQGSGSDSMETIAFINSHGQLKKVEMHNVRPVNATHVNISWVWEENSECDTKHAVQITCISKDGEEVIATVDSDLTHLTLGGLEAETAYDCTLKAVDNHGNFGPASKQFRIHTKQHPPEAAPIITKLRLQQLPEGFTTLLEWTAIELQQPNRSDYGCGYKIYIYISETATEPIILDMPVQRLSDRRAPSARLDGLKLMMKYIVHVAGYNPGGIGPISAPESTRLGSQSSIDLHVYSMTDSFRVLPMFLYSLIALIVLF
ncbi:unnamed protein product [Caenorhabditis bovis]|uniref:Uncharacterized protein n=1 Tax=Caenorhabditis bovis TaxID=2654633 RepID=A0A8S1FE70_9PELO|nr:unnamed protein product [Caenorhabditis bovis]